MKLLPFQKEFIYSVYGTDINGKRKVRQAVLSCPRKQGKTGTLACLALCHLLGCEAEARGQCFSCANTRQQAAILFKEMKAIIRQTPWMNERVTIRDFTKEIEDLETGSTYQALSADAGTVLGLAASFICYDELGSARSRDLFDAMASSQGSRKEPLLIVISSQAQSSLHPLSELIDYGLRIQSGEISDDTFHLTLFAAPDDADPWSPETWRACNPALGFFLNEEDLASAALKAQRLPTQAPAFFNLRLNRRVCAESRFINPALWDACSGAVDPESLRGCKCYGGLDLSSTTDTSALVLFFPDSGAVLSWFWLPGDGLREKAENDRVPYALWKDQGFLQALPGKAVDRRAIALQVADIASLYDLQGCAFDRWRFEDLQKILSDEGIPTRFIPWGQGFKDFSPAVSEFERLLVECKFKHGGNPILRWNAGNAVSVVDAAGNVKITRSGPARAKVDGIISLVMACGLSARMREERPLGTDDFSGGLVVSF